MKFYSEELKKFFDNEKECVAAESAAKVEREKREAEAKERAAQKDARKAEVDKAWEEAQKAYSHYVELFEKYCDDYKCGYSNFFNSWFRF